MTGPLIAIVGDTNPARTFDPPMHDPVKARAAAEALGAELARRGARLLVYGGPFVESDVVRGFATAEPATDRSIVKWYTKDQEPAPFPEEATHPRLFDQRVERGVDWEIAFYRSITRADGVVLIGGANATKVVGQVAIGSRIPLLCLSEFGGAAAQVWDTLSAGEDLPTREEITWMAESWTSRSATRCVDALLAQGRRRDLATGSPRPLASMLAAGLFMLALSIVPYVWGRNSLAVWMLFMAPLLAGGSGAVVRPMVDRLRGLPGLGSALLATLVLGLVAGGISGVLFVTAQLAGSPTLATGDQIAAYAQRSLPFAVGIGFVAGLTSDAVFGKLLGLDVVQESGVTRSASGS